MTLRLELSIIYQGDEDKKNVIDTINISNVGYIDQKLCEYIIEYNDYKKFNDKTPRVAHNRDDGAWKLVELALKKLKLI